MTYGEIRAHLIELLNRSDCTSALADTFISRGIARSQRLLRVAALERTDEITIGAVFDGIDVPNDFIAPIALYRESSSTGGYKLKRVSLSEYLNYPVSSGNPNIWTRKGAKLLLKPTPSEGDVLTLLYYGEFEEFTDDNDTTPMSVVAPELFYWGGLVYAAEYFLDDRQAQFESNYLNVVAELQNQSDTEELSGGAVMEPAYSYPGEDY